MTIFSFISLNSKKVYGISIENNKEEIVELTKNETDFFDKMRLKQQYLDEEIMVVDTINGMNKETIEIEGVKYEKDALVYAIFQASQNSELNASVNKYSDAISLSDRRLLSDIQEKANLNTLSYSDISKLFDDERFILEN